MKLKRIERIEKTRKQNKTTITIKMKMNFLRRLHQRVNNNMKLSQNFIATTKNKIPIIQLLLK